MVPDFAQINPWKLTTYSTSIVGSGLYALSKTSVAASLKSHSLKATGLVALAAVVGHYVFAKVFFYMQKDGTANIPKSISEDEALIKLLFSNAAGCAASWAIAKQVGIITNSSLPFFLTTIVGAAVLTASRTLTKQAVTLLSPQ